jgi:hypothetical protein
MPDPTTPCDDAVEDLARRIESQAVISAVPGQLAELEQIAREVRSLGSELERLRGVEERARERHAKAVSAADSLESWRTTEDERARIVLCAKWGSARFYRDKLAYILGEA